METPYQHSRADLQRLHRWLSYELSTPLLLLAWFVLPGNLLLLALKMAAVAATPLILRTLYRAQRKGWIVAFLVVVGVPALGLLIPVENVVLEYVLRSLPLVMFYLYCWALRHSVGEWLEALRWREQYAAVT